MRVFRGIEDLRAALGEEIGPTEWVKITQQRVNLFAEATDDHQWIHVDRERAAGGPFGGTIAHGYLTLSLVPMLASRLFVLDTEGPKLNYGINKVRFPHPVPVDARIRATVSVAEVSEVKAGTQLVMRYVVEIEDIAKPAMVAETVVLFVG